VLLALNEERQRPLEDEVDLLLARVTVDPPALARLEHDLVDPEACDPELPAKRQEPLPGVGVQARARDAFLHDRAAYGAHGSARRRAR
jgi:hypothetical protein